MISLVINCVFPSYPTLEVRDVALKVGHLLFLLKNILCVVFKPFY